MVPVRVVTLAFSVLSLALAGCIAEDPVDDGEAVAPPAVETRDAIYARVAAIMEGVPCEAEVGAGTSANLKDLSLIGFEDLGGTASLDFHGDMMVAATQGLAVVNVSDPLAPRLLSVFGGHGYGDVKISRDGTTAIGGAGTTIELIDIRDPENPTLMSEWSLNDAGKPNAGVLNAHMLYTAYIAEQHWVFVAANNNDGVWILRMDGEPGARTLEFVTSTLPVQGGPMGPHDMWVTHDEATGKWLLYSADGFHGWTVFDVSDPAAPVLAGGHVRPETGYTHTIQAAWIGDKRIVATIAEVGLNLLEVYDATELRAPVLLGTWHLNIEQGAPPQPAAPQHEFNIVDGKLYLGHYANGFYVFDLEPVAAAPPVAATLDLRPIAHYAAGSPGVGVLFEDIWSVDVIDGLLYVSSMTDGVHVVGFGCNTVGDPLLTSTG